MSRSFPKSCRGPSGSHPRSVSCRSVLSRSLSRSCRSFWVELLVLSRSVSFRPSLSRSVLGSVTSLICRAPVRPRSLIRVRVLVQARQSNPMAKMVDRKEIGPSQETSTPASVRPGSKHSCPCPCPWVATVRPELKRGFQDSFSLKLRGHSPPYVARQVKSKPPRSKLKMNNPKSQEKRSEIPTTSELRL